ncbi:MAG: T9SS type A sorting domain-containing protein [Bacteroidota bacterium]|nr:T9SS type A sorting domain-containing protein [Bacteroidota bacterium]
MVNTPGVVVVRLYDTLGRFQRAATIEGQINQLDTSGLRPGLYLLRVQAEGQAQQVIRVIVQ